MRLKRTCLPLNDVRDHLQISSSTPKFDRASVVDAKKMQNAKSSSSRSSIEALFHILHVIGVNRELRARSELRPCKHYVCVPQHRGLTRSKQFGLPQYDLRALIIVQGAIAMYGHVCMAVVMYGYMDKGLGG